MPKLPRLSGAEMARILAKFGFVKIRQRGSHVVLRKDVGSGSIGCVVPLHEELALGTMHGILKQAQVNPNEFIQLAR